MGILNLDIRTGCNLKERNHVGIRPVSDENRADDSEHAVKMGKFYHCSVSQLHQHNLGSAVAGLGMGDMANFKRYVDSLEASNNGLRVLRKDRKSARPPPHIVLALVHIITAAHF
jgi:hypothetical protein